MSEVVEVVSEVEEVEEYLVVEGEEEAVKDHPQLLEFFLKYLLGMFL